MNNAAVVKRCGSCKSEHSASSWAALAYVGVMDDGIDQLELRNCACGSTIAIETPRSSATAVCA